MTEAHSQRAHARLAPSAAHRWLNCPGSVSASVGIPETSSRFADEGTAAHTLVERCFREGVDADTYLGCAVDVEAGAIISGVHKLDRYFYVTEEMAEAAQMFLDYVRPLCEGAEVEVEAKLDLRHIEGMDFGTGDFTAYHPATGTLNIVDFKYGSGVVVEAREHGKPNPQLAVYALGVVKRYEKRGLKMVWLTVVQPRAAHRDGPIRATSLDPLEVMDFEQDLREGAARALALGAPRKAGDWCRFCPASGQCDTQAAKSADIAKAVFAELLDEDASGGEVVEGEIIAADAPLLMSSHKLATALKNAYFLKAWLKAVEEYAHAEALAGRVPPGFKLVPKRAMRKWAAGALDVLPIDEADLYVREPKSPAEVERLMPGKNKAERAAALAPFVVKESSETNLVPDDDPRSPARPSLLEALE